MKVNIKNLNVSLEVKNNGVEFAVYDTQDNFLGDMFVTKTGLIWCSGKTKKVNGLKMSWRKFIEYMEC